MAKTKTETEAALVSRIVMDLLRRSGRNVKPEVLVQEAKNPKHALHHKFEWDNAKAGHKHRVDQARKIIASVRITTTTDTLRITSYGFTRDPTLGPNESGYVAIPVLRTEADNAAMALQAEIDRVVAQLERCRELAAALDLMVEFEELWAGAQRLQHRSRKGPAYAKDTDVHVS